MADLWVYLKQCWSVTFELWDRGQQMIGVLAAAFALPIMWFVGGKLELTVSGFWWFSAWLTTSYLLMFSVYAPFQLWKRQKQQLSELSQLSQQQRSRPSRDLVRSLRLALAEVRDIIFSPTIPDDVAVVTAAYGKLQEALDSLAGVEEIEEKAKRVRDHAHGIFGAMFVHDNKSKLLTDMESGRKLVSEIMSETSWAARDDERKI